MPRRGNPDGRLDADYGSGSLGTKQADVIAEDEFTARTDDRAGLRDLDAMVESSAGLTRQQRDRERAMPRDTTGEVGHPAMERRLPEPDAVRAPLSSRQRKARSITKHATQEKTPATEDRALMSMITDDARWRQVNDLLSENTGDVQALDDQTRMHVQRLDRTIQRYERNNDRGHVVYANVRMPSMINSSNLTGFVHNAFPTGNVIEFDRYTGTAHTMHELEAGAVEANRTAVFEIQTRRGIYLGHSDSTDDTTHVLPRGMRLKIVGTHWARYRRPDGTQGQRQVIQLLDVSTKAGSSEENER